MELLFFVHQFIFTRNQTPLFRSSWLKNELICFTWRYVVWIRWFPANCMGIGGPRIRSVPGPGCQWVSLLIANASSLSYTVWEFNGVFVRRVLSNLLRDKQPSSRDESRLPRECPHNGTPAHRRKQETIEENGVRFLVATLLQTKFRSSFMKRTLPSFKTKKCWRQNSCRIFLIMYVVTFHSRREIYYGTLARIEEVFGLSSAKN